MHPKDSFMLYGWGIALQWRHDGRDGVSNHQPHDYLLHRLFKAQIKENIKAPRHWPLWNSPVGGEFPAQMASNAEYVSIWWRHHSKSASMPPQYAHSFALDFVISAPSHA